MGSDPELSFGGSVLPVQVPEVTVWTGTSKNSTDTRCSTPPGFTALRGPVASPHRVLRLEQGHANALAGLSVDEH